MRMAHTLRYLKKALLLGVGVLLLSAAVFTIARLGPGDPLVAYYGDRTEKMTVEEREQAMERLGLRDPIPVQYVRWLGNALQGNFGISYQYKQDVLEVIRLRLGNTLLLGGLGFVLTFAGALLLGMLCAAWEDTPMDRLLCRLGTLSSCIPEFWLCLLLILVFCVRLHWLPSSGAYSVGGGDALDRLRHLILPLTAVVVSHLWYYAYMVRNRLLEEMRADYVLLARAKGLSRTRILLGHCLRGILPACISMMAVSVPHILGGTYIVEMVFSYPGIGTLSYESARYADYNLLMVLCVLTGMLVICCDLAGQLVSERLDPRMKAGEREDA